MINKTNRISSKALISRCRFGSYNYVAEKTGMYNVTMGSYCSIGPGCDMGGMEHPYSTVSTSGRLIEKQINVAETVIGNDVWIGAQSYIKAGVKIGQGAVIGAQSFVNKDVPPYAIVFGSPAHIYKYRFDDKTIQILLKSEYWNYTPEEAKEIIKNLMIK